MTTEERIRIAEGSLSRQLEWVRSVETKVSVLVAVTTGMLGVLAVRVPEEFESWVAVALLTALGAAGQIACLFFCGLATFPRLKHNNLSLLFFATIAAHTEREYVEKFKSIDNVAYLDDLTKQVYRNAEIAKAKYGNVKVATVSLLCSVPLWLVAVYCMGLV